MSHRHEALGRMLLLAISMGTFLLTPLGCGGSHPWYLVESRWSLTSAASPETDVVTTDYYDGLSKAELVVALRAPDRCANLSSAELTGEVGPSGDLLKTDCGVEMAELERALVRGGYRVMSWNEVNALVQRETGTTPLQAARSLGADVLFQVNSLDLARNSGSWIRHYFESGPYGQKGERTAVPSKRAAALSTSMRALEESWSHLPSVVVTIDVTAVNTESGESIWFYHGRRVKESADSGSFSVSQLFECHREIVGRCLKRVPRQRPRPYDGGRESSAPRKDSRKEGAQFSGSRELVEPAAELEAYMRESYFKLAQELIADLVSEYTGRP